MHHSNFAGGSAPAPRPGNYASSPDPSGKTSFRDFYVFEGTKSRAGGAGAAASPCTPGASAY